MEKLKGIRPSLEILHTGLSSLIDSEIKKNYEIDCNVLSSKPVSINIYCLRKPKIFTFSSSKQIDIYSPQKKGKDLIKISDKPADIKKEISTYLNLTKYVRKARAITEISTEISANEVRDRFLAILKEAQYAVILVCQGK